MHKELLEIILLAGNTTNLSVYSLKDCIYLNDFLLEFFYYFKLTSFLLIIDTCWQASKVYRNFIEENLTVEQITLFFPLNWEKTRTALF